MPCNDIILSGNAIYMFHLTGVSNNSVLLFLDKNCEYFACELFISLYTYKFTPESITRGWIHSTARYLHMAKLFFFMWLSITECQYLFLTHLVSKLSKATNLTCPSLFQPRGPQGCSRFFPAPSITGNLFNLISRSPSKLFPFLFHSSSPRSFWTSFQFSLDLQVSKSMLLLLYTNTVICHSEHVYSYLLIFTSSIHWFLSIPSLDMTHGHLIFNVLQKHLNMNVSILLLSTSFVLNA